ncbi:MAG: tRNA (adenosine(37)-N6)-threonylcarbamoyltransferase complex ATPase subunit type 1 TsaE [Candidatus Binatia bacterium]
MGSWTVISRSSRATMGFGKSLGKLVQGSEIIGLVGELGAGKTCFVRGFAAGAGVGPEAWVRSPTFTLINEYQGRLPVYHIDLYRVGRQEEIEALNLREYLYADGVSLIEWFEYLPAAEVDDYLEVRVVHGGGARRQITFTAHGDRYEQLIEKLKESASGKTL